MGLGGEKWEGGLRERARGIGREDMEGENWEGAWEEDHGSRRGDMGGAGGHGRMDMGWEERYGRGDIGEDIKRGTWDWDGRHGREDMGGGKWEEGQERGNIEKETWEEGGHWLDYLSHECIAGPYPSSLFSWSHLSANCICIY